jgi:hypothetical protein
MAMVQQLTSSQLMLAKACWLHMLLVLLLIVCAGVSTRQFVPQYASI